MEFSGVFNSLVLPICEELGGNLKLFDKRSRRESKNLDVRPLVLEFDSERFTSVEENLKFIEALSLLEKASTSVLHNNPYVQLSIIDYIDGSTFDVWIMHSKEVVIVPQLKSTPPAINRLVSHIFDNYAECNITEFKGIN